MRRTKRSKRANGTEYTGIKMERDLYDQAKQQAQSRHQTYSEYVRQLIVRDIEKSGKELIPA
jgi:hypothetical protein